MLQPEILTIAAAKAGKFSHMYRSCIYYGTRKLLFSMIRPSHQLRQHDSVALQLDLLPAAPALTLTGGQAAISLLGTLRTRPECRAARRAPTVLHGCLSASKKRGA
jgi:hypothetical protein